MAFATPSAERNRVVGEERRRVKGTGGGRPRYRYWLTPGGVSRKQASEPSVLGS